MMTCCICGKLYDPVERSKKFFSVVDTENFEVVNVHQLRVDGKTLALCHTCMKAAGLGKIVYSKSKRYIMNGPWYGNMFEIDQNWGRTG